MLVHSGCYLCFTSSHLIFIRITQLPIIFHRIFFHRSSVLDTHHLFVNFWYNYKHFRYLGCGFGSENTLCLVIIFLSRLGLKTNDVEPQAIQIFFFAVCEFYSIWVEKIMKWLENHIWSYIVRKCRSKPVNWFPNELACVQERPQILLYFNL